MAKYTETLREYIEGGGELPEEFEEIEGFEDLFIANFCDKEIGFETEELFKIKLSGRAGLVIPAYASRISQIAREILKIDNPAKTFYENAKATTTFGTQKSKTTELPIDADEAEPNVISESDEYENENENTINREEKGKNASEVLSTLNYLNGKVRIILNELLNEFNSLFMQVY